MTTLLDTATIRRYETQFAAIREMPPPIPKETRYKFSIEDAKLGAFIKFGSNTYHVTAVNTYKRQGFRWPELVLYCLQDGNTTYLEWEKGDEISVYLSLERLTFHDVGIRDEEALWKISEDEAGEASYQGNRFSYHEDSAVIFYRDGKGDGTPFHQYLFSSDNGETYIAVEEWGDEDEGYEHNVTLSAKLNSNAIEILSTGHANA